MPSSRNMLDDLSGEALLSKSSEDGYKLIESITANIYQWAVTMATSNLTQKRTTGFHEVTKMISLITHVAQIHQMIKNMMTLEVTKPEPVKVVTNTSEVACVYYGGAHKFEEYSTNPVSFNYVERTNIKTLTVTLTIQVGAITPISYGVITKINQSLKQLNYHNILLAFLYLIMLCSTEAPASASAIKNLETCQVIKLQSGKEYEGFTPRNKQSSEELPAHDSSKDDVESTKEPSLEGHNEEIVNKNSIGMTSNS
ncbi:hypothetical protein KIW84_044719 [Lathyrus oleraceus]|uniref:Uncharacterized protein n=1 Tax=Pisum sativum TaxID=3888 RepID=A0A9D4XLQ3_PEA|nr:hypothetical protein KIW84_044719 [Pisum sativum]